MADQFVGEVRLVGFNFAPTGWALCQGQLMAISQNTALFSLLGTFYGGDGKSTFALPNLQGCVALGAGQGPGLSLYDIGETAGEQAVTLLTSEIPAHTHTVMAATSQNQSVPGGNALGQGQLIYVPDSAPLPPLTPMSIQSSATAGSGLPHNNMMPYLTLNWIIALQGIFPPRS